MRSCAHKIPTICPQMPKLKKGNNSVRRTPPEKQKNTGPLIFLVDAMYKNLGS